MSAMDDKENYPPNAWIILYTIDDEEKWCCAPRHIKYATACYQWFLTTRMGRPVNVFYHSGTD